MGCAGPLNRTAGCTRAAKDSDLSDRFFHGHHVRFSKLVAAHASNSAPVWSLGSVAVVTIPIVAMVDVEMGACRFGFLCGNFRSSSIRGSNHNIEATKVTPCPPTTASASLNPKP